MKLGSFLRSISLYLGLLALFVAGAMVSDQFLSLDNQRDVLWQVSSNGIIAVGMTLVILTGGIDLSVGSMLSLCSVVCAMLLMERSANPASHLAVLSFSLVAAWLAARGVGRLWPRALSSRAGRWVARLIGVGVFGICLTTGAAAARTGFGVMAVLLMVPPVGMVLGALCGLIIAKAKLQPFIVTLAMMVSAVGLAKYIAGAGGQIHPVYFEDAAGRPMAPRAFETLAANLPPSALLPGFVERAIRGGATEHPFLDARLIPVPGIFFAASAVLAWFLLARLRIGRYIYATGGNEETARLSGINIDGVKILVYAASGMLSALAAVLYCAQYLQGKADAGSGRELDAIAAVVIGGTSLMGGRGGIGGTVVGVFIFGYLGNILNLRGVPTEFQAILKGLIIVLAVLLQEGILARWLADGYRRVTGLFRNTR